MTVSYNLDISTANSFSFYKILFRWKGSIWKTTFWEFLIWVILYYLISFVYRFLLPMELQIDFANLSKHLDTKLKYLPIVLLLGFFVKIVFDRWKGVFENVGFIDAAAFTVCTYIRGIDEDTILARRSILRYLCLTQVLVLRDVSTKVRQRFPNTNSVVLAGFLLPHEKEYLNKYKNSFDRYWVPMTWAAAIVARMRQEGKITSDTFSNNVMFEMSAFQKRLQGLCYNDWVPVPLAYPQTVFMCTRIFMAICLFSRQFLMHAGEKDGNTIDAVVPFMTMLQVFFYLGWTKVAEELLNPLGTDDDDLEANYIIDRNINLSMMLAEEYYNQFPEQFPDCLDANNPPRYAEDLRKPTHPYKGSAANINFKTESKRPPSMLSKYSISKESLPKKNQSHELPGQLVWPVKLERSISYPLAISYKKQENGHDLAPSIANQYKNFEPLSPEELFTSLSKLSNESIDNNTFSKTLSYQPKKLESVEEEDDENQLTLTKNNNFLNKFK